MEQTRFIKQSLGQSWPGIDTKRKNQLDNKQAFAALVEKEVRDTATEDEIKILESAPDQWRLCLLDLLQSVNGQIAKNQIDFKYVMESEEEIKTSAQWKYRANAFRNRVITRITAVKAIIKQRALDEIRERQEKAATQPARAKEKHNMDDLIERVDALTVISKELLQIVKDIYSEIPNAS